VKRARRVRRFTARHPPKSQLLVKNIYTIARIKPAKTRGERVAKAKTLLFARNQSPPI